MDTYLIRKGIADLWDYAQRIRLILRVENLDELLTQYFEYVTIPENREIHRVNEIYKLSSLICVDLENQIEAFPDEYFFLKLDLEGNEIGNENDYKAYDLYCKVFNVSSTVLTWVQDNFPELFSNESNKIEIKKELFSDPPSSLPEMDSQLFRINLTATSKWDYFDLPFFKNLIQKLTDCSKEYVNLGNRSIWLRNERVVDSYLDFEKRFVREVIMICDEILKFFPNDLDIKNLRKVYDGELIELKRKSPIPDTSLINIINSINDAFFKFESFAWGEIIEYQPFNFNDSFTLLFNEVRKFENYNFSNTKLIGQYWKLVEQIRFDYEGYGFNQKVENIFFEQNCIEISYLAEERGYEFFEFYPVEEYDESFSIKNILNSIEPQQGEVKNKNEKLKYELFKHGFDDLNRVSLLSESNKKKLIDLFTINEMPYTIAMFEYLGFINHLIKNYFGNKDQFYKSVSEWFNVDERTFKGNVLVLNPKSTENKERYTSWKHQENAKKDYEELK